VRGRGLSREKVEKAVRLSEEKYCTVGRALSKATTITHTVAIIEE
jgi:putative redox protein